MKYTSVLLAPIFAVAMTGMVHAAQPDGVGKPDFAGSGKPEWAGSGKPDFAGKPDGVGSGKPDFAGKAPKRVTVDLSVVSEEIADSLGVDAATVPDTVDVPIGVAAKVCDIPARDFAKGDRTECAALETSDGLEDHVRKAMGLPEEDEESTTEDTETSGDGETVGDGTGDDPAGTEETGDSEVIGGDTDHSDLPGDDEDNNTINSTGSGTH